MALAYHTYSAIPTLRNYGDALTHHNNVMPIRRREIDCRPCGRRDQTFFTIWKDAQDVVHVGYGGGKFEDRAKLVSFHPNGGIDLVMRYRGASTNERINSLLNVDIQTFQYDSWIRCSYYDNGTLKRGWLPLPTDPTIPANFVRTDNNHNGLTYINYTYPVTHKVNRAAMTKHIEQAANFLRYASGMWKLAGGRLQFDEATRGEAFGTEFHSYYDRHIPKQSPNLRYGEEKHMERAKFFAWVNSDDHMDYLRALITLEQNTSGIPSYDPVMAFKEWLLRTYPDELLVAEPHRDGRMVKDKYKRYFF